MADSFRFAHLSDLHFFQMTWGIHQFFSKRWIGNGNFIFRRKREFNPLLLNELSSILIQEKIPLVLISGDVSCTSLKKEFEKASLFVNRLQTEGIEVIILPGNHDKYTKKAADQKLFYQTFPSSLANDGLKVKQLTPSWWMIFLDTALPTPLFCCHGRFSEELEEKLEKTLKTVPSDAKVILANHFPILSKKGKDLEREDALLNLCKKHPQIKLYLHGHNHQPRIYDARSLGLPIVVDSGSAAHQFHGGWNRIECEKDLCTIKPYKWAHKKWTPLSETSFSWS